MSFTSYCVLYKYRQVVEFTQNTLSGKRVLVVNGVEQFRVNAQYKLTGCVNFVIDGVSASVVIEALGALPRSCR